MHRPSAGIHLVCTMRLVLKNVDPSVFDYSVLDLNDAPESPKQSPKTLDNSDDAPELPKAPELQLDASENRGQKG